MVVLYVLLCVVVCIVICVALFMFAAIYKSEQASKCNECTSKDVSRLAYPCAMCCNNKLIKDRQTTVSK